MAVIRDGLLWTCHHVGLDDAVEGDYDGDGTGSTVDRSAIQWLRLHITGTGELELQNSNDQGRIWDRQPSRIAHPLPVGRYKTSGYAYGVDVAGSYAYVADGEAGLQVLDVSNPTKPLPVGNRNTSGSARGVHVVGSYAYVADGGAGLQVIDISDPEEPALAGHCATSGSAHGVHVVGSYAYVADGEAGLQVIDISDPSIPTWKGGCDTSGFAYGVDVLGSDAYVADGLAGLEVINISDPAEPDLIGGYDTSGCAYGVQVVGSLAYVADGEAGLEVFSLGTSITRLGGCDTAGSACGVRLASAYAYVADGGGEVGIGGLQVIDVSTPNWYYFPSLMVNSAQDVVIGFSGSSCNSYIGAYYSWRRGPCTAMEGPLLIQAGEDYFDNSRWGDYSCTSLDPGDLQDPNGLSIWTVQQYALPGVTPPYPFQWGTWIARINPE